MAAQAACATIFRELQQNCGQTLRSTVDKKLITNITSSVSYAASFSSKESLMKGMIR
jgi:hypothetical protein